MILGLALVAVAVVALVIVNAGGGTGGTTSFGHSSDTPKDRYYVVRAGDTFATIAAKEGIGRALIERLNPNLDPLSIQPYNCVDLVPDGCRRLAARSSRPPAGKPEGPKDPYYVVQAGDSFSTIAAKEGVDLARIERLNPSHPNSIQPGNCVDLIRHGCRELAVHSSGRPLGFHHLP